MRTICPNNNFSTYLRLLSAAKPYWVSFAIGVIGTFVAIGVDSALIWAIKPFVDKGLVERSKLLLEWLPIIVVSAVIFRGFGFFLSNYFIMRVGRSVVMDFRQKIFRHLMHLPANYYDKESSGKLLALIIYNTEQVAAASNDALLTILQEGLSLIGMIVIMFSMSWQLTLSFMLTAPLIYFVIRHNSKRLRILSSNVQQSMGDVAHVAEESIVGYKVVRIFGGEEYEQQKFDHVSRSNRNREMKVIVTDSLGGSMVQVIASLPIAVIIWIATSSYLHVTAGSFSVMVAAMLKLLTPMRRLTKVNTVIQKGIAGAYSIFNLLDEKIEKNTGLVKVSRVHGMIEYKNVFFSYPNAKKEVLHDVNFSVEAGQTVALVGRSGGGKSTLISLLPRFYDVTKGCISIDGIDIHEYDLLNLRRQFAIVTQQLTLFNDTIAHNIAYGCLQDIDSDKIIRAAEAAHIMDFIKHLPEGLNTLIGENGVLLSGGQRQRIAIARALLKDAPILILDEATSALDTESEYHIQAALEVLMQKRTTLVIAHRLSTIKKANKIMVIEKGKIIENGNHQELLEYKGVYARLYKMQFKNENHV